MLLNLYVLPWGRLLGGLHRGLKGMAVMVPVESNAVQAFLLYKQERLTFSPYLSLNYGLISEVCDCIDLTQ